MKKTISIHLGGRAFILEDDGFVLLQDYLQKLKQQLSSDPSSTELIQDIENALADKFVECLQEYKQVITLEDTQKVISIMGNVEDIAETGNSAETESKANTTQTTSETSQEESQETKKNDIPKRLYRSTDDVVIAGVCSGLAVYLGIDPTIVRIVFIVLGLINGIGVLIYFILLIAVPEAETPAQILEMHGKKANIEEIQELHKKKNTTEKKSSFQELLNIPFEILRHIVAFFKAIWNKLGPVIRVLFGLCLSMISFFAIIACTVCSSVLLFKLNSPYIISDLPLNELSHNPLYYAGVISAYLLIVIPLFLILSLGIGIIRKKDTVQPWLLGICAIIWTLSIGGATAAAVDILPWANNYLGQSDKIQTQTKNVTIHDVQNVSVGRGIALHIEQGPKAQLTLRGNARQLQGVQIKEQGNQLELVRTNQEPEGICIFCREQLIDGVMTLPDLQSLELNQATAHIEKFSKDLSLGLLNDSQAYVALNGQSLTAHVSGYGSFLTLTGNASTITAGLNDFSKLQSKDLVTKKIQISLQDYAEAELQGSSEEADFALQDTSQLEAETFVSQKIQINTRGYAQANINPVLYLDARSADFSQITNLTQPASSTIQVQGESGIYQPK